MNSNKNISELRPQRRFSFSDNLVKTWQNEPVIWSALPSFMLKNEKDEEQEPQRGEKTAKKRTSDRDEFGMTGVKVEFKENYEAEQIQMHDEPNMEWAKKACSTDLAYVKNIWQSEMEGTYHQTMQNLKIAEFNWVIFLQKRGDSSKEVTTNDHSNRISLELKYDVDGKKEIYTTGKENVVHKDAKKIIDAPTTADAKGAFHNHIEGTKIKSQPTVLGALEEDNNHLDLQKQMLQDKSSSSEDKITHNSDNAHNGKHQNSMWSRFKIYLTDRLGSSILTQNQSGKVKEGKSDDGKSTSKGEEIPTQDLGSGTNYDDSFFPKSIANESKRNKVRDRLLNCCKSASSNRQLAIGGATGLVILTAVAYNRIRNN